MSTALVVGLGRSGRAAAALLRRRGWDVIAVDGAPIAAPELTALGIDVRAPSTEAVPGIDLVVKSPGVPSSATSVAAARAAGVPIWSEVELASRELANPIIGITGTNGKTTTTELTAHLIRSSGQRAVACGNQGLPVTALVDGVDPDAWLVVECSSFQLEDVHTFHPRGAVLLNLTPDHLDRHGSMEAYRAAKLNIFRHLTGVDLAIAPRGMAIPGGATLRHLDLGPPAPGAIAWDDQGLVVDGLGPVMSWDDVPLPGRHNRQNTMAAAALAAHAGASANQVARGLVSFPGVPHRLERVGVAADVLFVNDSKATNPDAAIAALDAYDRGVHLIVGGRAKGTSFDPLAAAAHAGVVRAYLIGEAGPEVGEAFARAGVATRECRTLERALTEAAAAARPGETVLLAPACASFDQFSGFEERGEAFRTAARGVGAR